MAQQPDAAAAQQLARLSHGSYGFKGLKDHYEDRVDTKHLGGLGLWFGVYDGHGGEHAATTMRLLSAGPVAACAAIASCEAPVTRNESCPLDQSAITPASPSMAGAQRPMGTKRVSPMLAP